MTNASHARHGAGRLVAVCAMMLAAGVAAGWQLRGIDGAARAAEDLNALGRAQVERFYAGTAGKADLAGILGKAFQLIRTDGTRYDRDGYLDNPASLQSYELDGFATTRVGDTLVVTFFASFKGTVEGIAQVVTRSPRLAVFTHGDGDWKLQAFANLGLGSATDAQAEAVKAVDAWLGALASGEPERIRGVLAPEFQIARADGSAYDAAGYLASDLPKIAATPKVDQLVATGYGDLLVTRYRLSIQETIGGKAVEGEAPRLTVFRRSGGAWLVAAHANFARLEQ